MTITYTSLAAGSLPSVGSSSSVPSGRAESGVLAAGAWVSPTLRHALSLFDRGIMGERGLSAHLGAHVASSSAALPGASLLVRSLAGEWA